MRDLIFVRCVILYLFVFMTACQTNHGSLHQAKITHLEEFIRPSRGTVVLAGGCFDLLHTIHIEFLRAAKKNGDYLIIALESDESIIRKKKRYPIYTQDERAGILSNLSCVDEVVLLPCLSGYEEYLALVKKIKPDIIAVTTPDSQLESKKRMAEAIGCKLVPAISEIKDRSTTKTIDKIRARKPEKIVLSGIVIPGKQEARRLGVPTLNIKFRKEEAEVREGVHRCRVLFDHKNFPGICYYDLDRPEVIEAHVLGQNLEKAPERAMLELTEFLRNKIYFESFDALLSQMNLDLLMVKTEDAEPHEAVR